MAHRRHRQHLGEYAHTIQKSIVKCKAICRKRLLPGALTQFQSACAKMQAVLVQPRKTVMPLYLNRDDPQPRDIEASWRDGDVDTGWTEDRVWTPRRVIMVAIVLLALLAFLATSIPGIFEALRPGALPPTPTPPPLPML